MEKVIVNVVKEKFQEAFDAYKSQFDGLFSPEKEKAFANCFTVTEEKGYILVDGNALHLVDEEFDKQPENITYIAEPEVLDIVMDEKTTLRVFFKNEHEQYLPAIAKVCLISVIYSE